jgi:hypothetical protein
VAAQHLLPVPGMEVQSFTQHCASDVQAFAERVPVGVQQVLPAVPARVPQATEPPASFVVQQPLKGVVTVAEQAVPALMQL